MYQEIHNCHLHSAALENEIGLYTCKIQYNRNVHPHLNDSYMSFLVPSNEHFVWNENFRDLLLNLFLIKEGTSDTN